MIITPNIYGGLTICLSQFATFGDLCHFLCKYVHVWHNNKHLHSVLFSQEVYLPAPKFIPHSTSTTPIGRKALSLVQLCYTPSVSQHRN